MKYLSWGESFDDTCNYRLVFLCVLRVSFCPSGDSTSLRSRTTFRACCFTISKNPRIELFEIVKPPEKDKRIESFNFSRAFVQRITTEHTIEITTNNERTHGSDVLNLPAVLLNSWCRDRRFLRRGRTLFTSTRLFVVSRVYVPLTRESPIPRDRKFVYY